MFLTADLEDGLPLFISRSNTTTLANQTGAWRFMRPRFDPKTAPCSAACPAGEDIGRIEMLAAQQRYDEAAQCILMENPFPAICGRVCFHACESACNRAQWDAPVAIRPIERFLGDRLLERTPPPLHGPGNGGRIAVIGAGPAGLSAAYFLARLGFACDVFEAQSAPGGLLRWGIPAYRLPQDVLDAEISRLTAGGVRIHCSTPATPALLEQVRREYDGLWIACGCGRSISLRIEGEAHAEDGLALLARIRSGEAAAAEGNVAVIGGGNAAIDVARSLLRLGADPLLLYRRRRQDMPAFDAEIEAALQEGVALRTLCAPAAIDKAQGRLRLSVQYMKTEDIGADGRMRVVPDEGREAVLQVDRVVVALGATAEACWRPPSTGEHLYVFSHCCLETGGVPVAYGGDLTNGIRSVAHAIASGKQAAIGLAAFLTGGPDAVLQAFEASRVGQGPFLSMEMYLGGERSGRCRYVVPYNEINTDYFSRSQRVQPPSAAAAEKPLDFREIEKTLDAPAARREADRCFNCGLCNDCDNCRLFCPEMAVVKADHRDIDLTYCKGCGICVTECPRSAMVLEEEVL